MLIGGVVNNRHLQLPYLWVQERLRLTAFRLHKEAAESVMGTHIDEALRKVKD